mgnify:CR=1 FL=1
MFDVLNFFKKGVAARASGKLLPLYTATTSDAIAGDPSYKIGETAAPANWDVKYLSSPATLYIFLVVASIVFSTSFEIIFFPPTRAVLLAFSKAILSYTFLGTSFFFTSKSGALHWVANQPADNASAKCSPLAIEIIPLLLISSDIFIDVSYLSLPEILVIFKVFVYYFHIDIKIRFL